VNDRPLQAGLSVDLLERARRFLSVARNAQSLRGDTTAVCCFCAQMAVERALESALAARGADLFSHDIALLAGLCAERGLALPPALADAGRLTPYAASFFDGLAEPESVRPSEALAWAELAVEWAEAQPQPALRGTLN
jgi:HEPN domain-containing protein